MAGWPDLKSQIPPSCTIFTAKFRPTKKVKKFIAFLGVSEKVYFLKNFDNNFFH